MGIRVSGPEVVAFLEWLRKEFPDLNSAGDIEEPALKELAGVFASEYIGSFDDYRGDRHGEERWNFRSDFIRHFVHEIWDGPMRRHRNNKGNDLVSAVRHPGYLFPNQRSRLGVEGRPGDLLSRYRSIPFRSVFLYTSQDIEFANYLKTHWAAWSDESGDVFDFYDFSIETGGRQPYTFSQNYIHRLRILPCADLIRIRAVGLPCMLVWSDDTDTIVPFADVVDSPSELRERFRLVQKFLAEDQLDGLRTYFSNEIKKAVQKREDVFISYRQTDRDWVSRLHDALEERGLSVWYDQHLRAGDRFDLRIVHHLSHAKGAVVVWSKESINSGYVLAEALMAWNRKRLLPIFKESDVAVPPPFNAMHSEDLSFWPTDKSGFDRLVDQLKDMRGGVA